MKKAWLSLLLLSAVSMAAPKEKEIKITALKGQVLVITGGNSAKATVGQLIQSGATLKTLSGAEATLSIGGATKVIPENSTLPANALSASDSTLESALNLLGKFSSRIYGGGGTAQVAGVRGAEQGKKGGFGVQWQTSGNAKAGGAAPATTDLEQARSLYLSQDYEGAIAKLSAFLSEASDTSIKAKAYLYLAQANLELVRIEEAVKAAEAGIALAPGDAQVITQLRFTAVRGAWISGKPDAALAAVETHFPANGALGEEYWNAQVIKLLALRSMGNKAAIRKAKEEINTGCTNEEILKLVGSLPN